ncbi:TetR/AcrR family transcriptional regulator [Streptomyces kaempferi]
MTTESRTGPGPRDRFRAQVREEVKAAALRQLAEGGPEALSLNAVAKQLGMTGPALYRYFANRDSLLTELVVDAYEALASALARAAAPPRGTGPNVWPRSCGPTATGRGRNRTATGCCSGPPSRATTPTPPAWSRRPSGR